MPYSKGGPFEQDLCDYRDKGEGRPRSFKSFSRVVSSIKFRLTRDESPIEFSDCGGVSTP